MTVAVRSGDLIDALGPSGAYRARTREPIRDVTGAPLVELTMVPELYITRAIAAMRASLPLDDTELRQRLDDAATLFRSERLCGLSPEEYVERATRASGLPVTVVEQSVERLATACSESFDRAHAAIPAATATSLTDLRLRGGGGLWVRRGAVLGVLAAGNHPGVHAHWLEAVALGYSVAVRPSRREPFTPARLVAALRQAGLGDDRVVFLPTDHHGADIIRQSADLTIAYGGDDVVRRYRGDPTVFTQGPGRSKMLITAEIDWRPHLDMIVQSAARHGGVSCTSLTSVFVEGDARGFADAIGERLRQLEAHPPLDRRSTLPVQSLADATRMAEHLRLVSEGTTPILGADQVIVDLNDGSAALRPTVHLLASTSASQSAIELPFPCVWVVPWDRSDGIAALCNSLVVSAITHDQDLIARLAAEPSIRNLYVGPHPTYTSTPLMPHDGYLGEFLMESKGVITS